MNPAACRVHRFRTARNAADPRTSRDFGADCRAGAANAPIGAGAFPRSTAAWAGARRPAWSRAAREQSNQRLSRKSMKQSIIAFSLALVAGASFARRACARPRRLRRRGHRGRHRAGHAAALEDEDVQRRREGQGTARPRAQGIHEAVPVGQGQAGGDLSGGTAMRARFAFPMQSTGRGIAAAPESRPPAEDVAPARARARGATRARWPPARRSVGACGTDLLPAR